MGFLDKIKKLFQNEEVPEQPKIEQISQKELQTKIESLLKTSKAKNNLLKERIDERISKFEIEVADSIKILSKNDLSHRKDYEKIKNAVLQNRDTYILYLNKLLKDIKKLDEPSTVSQINKILLAANDFRKASHLPYEKATYLIGREMAATMEIVKQFAKNISDIGEQNEPLFEETARIEQASSLLNELTNEEMLEGSINREILRLNLKIKGFEDEKEAIEKEIETITKSKEYQEDQKSRENQIKEQERIKKEIEKIKQRIDFKALSRVFHHDKKKASLIKGYSSNFIKALKEDEELSMISLVHESQSADIYALKELKEQLIQSESEQVLETEAKLSNLNERLNRIEAEKAKTGTSIEEESKKLEKQKAKKQKTLSNIKEVLGKLNIAIKD